MSAGHEIDMSESDYHSDPSLSHSRIETFIQSPRLFHARYVGKTIGDTETPARRLGKMLHCAVFEPGRWVREYAAAPKFDKRTNAGKADWARWQADHPDVTAVDPFDKAQVDGMAAALAANPHSRRMLVELEGKAELSLMWKDDASGLACRCRLDRLLVGLSSIVDLKSARFVTPDDLKRQAYGYGYHRKAAFYTEAHRQVYGENPEAFWFCSVHSAAPYEVCVWQWGAAAEAVGWSECRNAMDSIARAYDSGDWRAPWELEVVEFELPKWAAQTEEQEVAQ